VELVKKIISIFILFLFTAGILSGCTLSSQKAWAKWQKTGELDKEKQISAWEEDLEYLVNNLEKKHKDLYHSISREDFKKEEMKLSNSIRDLSDIGRFIEIKNW
jgi:flagellar basal body-associated protein FliL